MARIRHTGVASVFVLARDVIHRATGADGPREVDTEARFDAKPAGELAVANKSAEYELTRDKEPDA